MKSHSLAFFVFEKSGFAPSSVLHGVFSHRQSSQAFVARNDFFGFASSLITEIVLAVV
jgi:hypothetical protein